MYGRKFFNVFPRSTLFFYNFEIFKKRQTASFNQCRFMHNTDSICFRRSIRRMLNSFYKMVHPDLVGSLPQEMINVNNESLSVLNSYIDILSGSKANEIGNVFTAKKLIFFKAYENSEKKIIKDRYQNITIELPSICADMTLEEREQISATLIYDIQKSVNATSNMGNPSYNEKGYSTQHDSFENIMNEKSKREDRIHSIWEDLTMEVRNTEALFQPSEEEVERNIVKKRYFNYIKKKLELKFQRIHNKKRKKQKLRNLDKLAKHIVDLKFPQIETKDTFGKYRKEERSNENLEIFQCGYDPTLLFFHKDLKEQQKKQGIEHLCGKNLLDDADKWLLENSLKVLKNHKVPIPLVLYAGKEICVCRTFGIIYIPYNFSLNELFRFLENRIDEVREIRHKVVESF